jgi:tetratricopeptide (TPR) repeat protein
MTRGNGFADIGERIVCPMLTKYGRLIAVALFTLAAGACACTKRVEKAPVPGVTTGAPVRTESALVVRKSLAETREAIAAMYRLAPDRRLLLAITYLNAGITGGAAGKIGATFGGGVWHVIYQDQEVGTLPELFDFEDGQKLLSGFAERLLKDHPVSRVSQAASDPGASLLFYDAAIDALRKAQELWANEKERGNAVHLAAAATSSLAVQLLDSMHTADDLYARAWELVVLDEALGGKPVVSRALLASAMGYGAAAQRTAASLSPNDPVRAYVSGDDATMAKVASQPGATTATCYLWHDRLLAKGKTREAAQLRKQKLGGLALRMPIVFSRTEHFDFATDRMLSPAMPAITLLEMARLSKGPRTIQAETASRTLSTGEPDPSEIVDQIYKGLGVDPKRAISAFDEELARFADSGKAGPAAGSILKAYYRAAMYTSLRSVGWMLLHTLASNQASKAFSMALGDDPSPTVARFKSWYDYLVAARSNYNVTGELLDNIQKIEGFGGAAVMALFDEILEHLEWGSPASLTAARKVFGRLDTRPTNRTFVGQLAYNALVDLQLTEKMYRSAIDVAPGTQPWTQAWLAGFAGDAKLIASTLALPDLTGRDRIFALERREAMGGADMAKTIADMRRVAAEHSDNWATQQQIIDYLTEKEKWGDALQIAREWLAKNPEAPGLDPTMARVEIAKSLRWLGKNDEALAVIMPAIATWQGGAMREAARLLSITGKKDEAVKLAQACLKRYPFVASVIAMAEIHWRNGNPEAAAALLARPPVPFQSADWKTIGEQFARVFIKAKTPGAKEAFRALAKTGVPGEHLMSILGGMKDDEHGQLFIDLMDQIDAPRAQPYVAIGGLSIVRTIKGDAAAVAWGTPKMNAGPPVMMAALSATQLVEDPMWLTAEPPPGETRNTFWALRAVAAQWAPNSPHLGELRKHFEKKGTEREYLYGRAVMGMEDESTITPFASKDIGDACEVAYYLGAAAHGRRALQDASDWYRASIETSRFDLIAYRLAYNQLVWWRGQGKSLARLAADVK